MWQFIGVAGMAACTAGLAFFLSKDKCTKCGSRRLKKLQRNMIKSWKTKEMRLREYTDYTTNYNKHNEEVGYGSTSRKVREPATVTHNLWRIHYECKKCHNKFYVNHDVEDIKWKWND